MASFDVSMPYQSDSTNMAVKLETQVGEEYITPSFHKHLEEFYNKASPADQAKCLELSTSVRLGETIQSQSHSMPPYSSKIPKDVRRCKSAMAKLGSFDDINKTFVTTYGREYAPKMGLSALADRPATSRGYATTRDISGPIGLSNYSEEFCDKTTRPVSPIRSGSSSGQRNNNPHPQQAFMVWRFPSHGRKKFREPFPVVDPLNNEKIDQINRRLYTSTYQRDYLGIPQGYQMKSAFDLPPDWKSNVPFTLDTNSRIAYRNPIQQPQLSLPSTRYGANASKHIPTVGSIPAINRYLLDLKTKTTYDRHYNGNATAVTQQIQDLARNINVESLKKYYNTSTGEEREIVGKMLESLKPCVHPRPPSTHIRGLNRVWRATPTRTPYTTQESLQYSQIPDTPHYPHPPSLLQTS